MKYAIGILIESAMGTTGRGLGGCYAYSEFTSELRENELGESTAFTVNGRQVSQKCPE